MVKQRLIDFSKQDWSTVIAESSKTLHYTFIMPELQEIIMIFHCKFRITLSKLRCSVYNLNVETG